MDFQQATDSWKGTSVMKAIVKDVMTTQVVSVRQDATYKDLAALLGECRVSAFPVLDGEGRVVGVVSATDLMTRPAITITPDDTVVHAARLMQGKHVKRLAVVTADGRLAGIVSRADVLSVYSRPDGDIRLDITKTVILDTFLTDPARFTVTVTNGIVTIEGQPETRTLGVDILDSIRHVDGVVAVRDRLAYPPDERPSRPLL
jgi:CBS domain-containing protein